MVAKEKLSLWRASKMHNSDTSEAYSIAGTIELMQYWFNTAVYSIAALYRTLRKISTIYSYMVLACLRLQDKDAILMLNRRNEGEPVSTSSRLKTQVYHECADGCSAGT